jgi:hypothetical protein
MAAHCCRAAGAYNGKFEAHIRGSGYVVQSLEAVLWVFERTDSFEDAILMAANLGDDADTTTAVCGQVAGAYYGEPGTISTLRITRLASIDGYEYFLTSWPLAFAWTTMGLSMAILDDAELGLEASLRYPPPETPYDYDSPRASDSHLYITVDQGTIDTPAGDFTATTYRLFRGEDHGFLFSISFATGVGFVRLANGFGTTWFLSAVDLVTNDPVFPFQPSPPR